MIRLAISPVWAVTAANNHFPKSALTLSSSALVASRLALKCDTRATLATGREHGHGALRHLRP